MDMSTSKPWYLSRTVWASLVGIALSAAGFLGVTVDAFDSAGLTDALLQAATAIAGLVALFGRLAANQKIG